MYRLVLFALVVMFSTFNLFAQQTQNRPQLRPDQDAEGHQLLRMDEMARMPIDEAERLVETARTSQGPARSIANAPAKTSSDGPLPPTSTTTGSTSKSKGNGMIDDGYIVDYSSPLEYNMIRLYLVLQRPIASKASIVISMENPVTLQSQVIDAYSYEGVNQYGLYATVWNGSVVGLYGDRVAKFKVSYSIDGVAGSITNEQRTYNKLRSTLFVTDASSTPMAGSARVVLHGKFREGAKTGILFGGYELSRAAIESVTGSEIVLNLWADPDAARNVGYEGPTIITVKQKGQTASVLLTYLRLTQ